MNNMAYKIVNMWTPSSMYSYKSPYAMRPTSITVHNTGNIANARNEVAYMNNNYNYVSYHVAIDEKEAVQAIPFNRNAFAAGDGIGLNSGNRTSIHIEICYSMDNGYSGAKSARYKKAEDNAALYIAHVLKQYGWGIDRLKRHYDWSGKDCPHKMHATNSYQAFRRKVQRYLDQLNGKKVTKDKSKKVSKKKTTVKSKSKTISQLADEVLAGKHGNGDARKRSLGSNYAKVQAEINRRFGVKSAPKKKSTAVIVNEVIAGKWGNGQDRFNRLKKAGYDPNVIQREVNKRY